MKSQIRFTSDHPRSFNYKILNTFLQVPIEIRVETEVNTYNDLLS